jgi:FAD/FMN-containing dehydrogenase
MTTVPGSSWGRWPRHAHAQCVPVTDRFRAPDFTSGTSCLPWGNGRSYGDSCQNADGRLLVTRGLDRFIAFDPATGVLECEAGVQLADIIELVLPQGWFVPVTPGTRFVTVGGAIANDVHGKNHHLAGSFGHHVLGFELLRSDGTSRWCAPEGEHTEWFAASVGGLGLTGLIRRVRLQLRHVPGAWLAGESRRFGNLAEFFVMSQESDRHYEYTVSWVDCTARGHALGRGVFMRGNHAAIDRAAPRERPLRVPFTPPLSLINRLSLQAFNRLYYSRPSAECRDAVWHYLPFFYPLDRLLEWNRIYGPRGFYQYQCVVPPGPAQDALTEIIEAIARSGSGSFLAVLKMFGDRPSSGMLSFPRPGATLALDFPNHGQPTLDLLERLDAITRAAGGAVYPAKDARMSAVSFQQYFPRWREFGAYVDPRFSSSFWRRVTEPVS